MGMYDEFHDESGTCPVCLQPLTTFQSKDGPCTLRDYYLGDVIEWLEDGTFNMHQVCHDYSDHWVEAIGVVYRWRWIATIITRVRKFGVGLGEESLWSIRKPRDGTAGDDEDV